MVPFTIERATSVEDVIAAPGATVIAGGTELVNWLKEGIAAPSRLLDINHLPGLHAIEATTNGLRLGALARLADVAAHPLVNDEYPAIAEALRRSASQQLRNMASMGGNLMQRTRCPYFRAEVELPCNKRRPGSGCSALTGEDRAAAIFGGSEHCIATHPSDVAVALAALDAVVEVRGANGLRHIPLVDFHRLPEAEPERETVLEPGELIVAIDVPKAAVARRSWYLKLRERASYEFALVSVAAAVDLQDGVIREARLALGGVAPRPWRLRAAESALAGVAIADEPALRTAVDSSFDEVRPGRHNGFKVELAKRAAVRTLGLAGGVS